MKNTGKQPINLFDRPQLSLVEGDGRIYMQDTKGTQASVNATSGGGTLRRTDAILASDASFPR